jgi:hypothetical protein
VHGSLFLCVRACAYVCACVFMCACVCMCDAWYGMGVCVGGEQTPGPMRTLLLGSFCEGVKRFRQQMVLVFTSESFAV